MNMEKRFYVTAIDAQRVAYLAGPFLTHEEALTQVERCRDMAYELDQTSHFWWFGTAKRENGDKQGIFTAAGLFDNPE